VENVHREEYGNSSSGSLYPELVKLAVEYMDPSNQPFPVMGNAWDKIKSNKKRWTFRSDFYFFGGFEYTETGFRGSGVTINY
jgi:hypothetical protein